MKKIFSVFTFLLILTAAAFAQEDCKDGVDNDGDGLIDCLDPDCTPAGIEEGCHCEDGLDNDGDGYIDVFDVDCASFYGLSFVGDDTDCAVTPPFVDDPFAAIGDDPAMSGQNTVDTQSKMAIGDIDGDGIPDVTSTSKWNQSIRVIATTDNQSDGKDKGDVKASWKAGDKSAGDQLKAGGSTFYFDLETMIADIDGDGVTEMFATLYQRNNSSKAIEKYWLAAFEYDGTTQLVNTWATDLGPKRPGTPGITDFDGDGNAEIYLKNSIYAAESGNKLADEGGDWNTSINGAPTAVNIIRSSPNLELVCGERIYSVPDMSARSMVTLTETMNMNSLGLAQYYPKVFNDVFEYGITNFSSTSVADFDDDGEIDVFLSGAIGSTSGHTAVFYWNVAKGTVSTFLPAHPDTGTPPSVVTYPNGWPWGTGRVNLGELDGDGILEANFIAGNQLYALEESPAGSGLLVDMWGGARTLNDFRSGVVSTTVYDFDNDGMAELVYRDTQVLSVIDGATGATTYWSTSCQSHTMTEGPIIADMNGDGSTDISVPCFTGPGLFKIDGPLSSQALGEIRVFYSDEDAWLPTRKVYNQPGYFVVNINDDLTLPFPQLDQTMIFGTDACDNGLPGPQQPFNTFLNQVPYLGPGGCPVYPGPDISFVGHDPNLLPGDSGYVSHDDPNYFPAVEVIPPVCGSLEITANFNIINDGLRAITSDIPVSFWDGDPELDLNATLLHDVILGVQSFGIGDTLSYHDITFNSTGKAFDLYVILNDDGTTPPPIVIGAAIEECKLGNNKYKFPIIPQPFTVQLEVIQDNNKCLEIEPNTGEVRAAVYEGGTGAIFVPISDTWTKTIQTSLDWNNSADWSGTAPGFNTNQSAILRHNSIVTSPITVNNGDTLVIATGVTLTTSESITIKEGGTLIINGLLIGTDTNKEFKVGKGGLVINATGALDWDGFWNSNDSPASIQIAGSVSIGGDMSNKVTISGSGSISVGGTLNNDGGSIFDCTSPSSSCCTGTGCILGGGIEVADYSKYGFQWFAGSDTLATVVHDTLGGQTDRIVQVPEGTYTVVVTNLEKGCKSLPITTVVGRIGEEINALISVISDQTKCSPFNGKLEVNVVGGNDGYEFEWYRTVITNPLGVTSTVIDNLEKDNYLVKISKNGGCPRIFQQAIAGPQFPEALPAVVAHVTDCADPNSGIVDAEAYVNDTLQTATDYEFTWYHYDNVAGTAGSHISSEYGTGKQRTGLPVGWYAVSVRNIASQCESTPPIPIEVLDNTQLPEVLITELYPNSSCDPDNPNGQLHVDISLGGIAQDANLYTIEWFKGDNTLPANQVTTTSGINGDVATDVGSPGIPYTVQVTSALNCYTSDTLSVSQNIIIPAIAATPSPNSICDPALATADYNGAVSSSVTYNGLPVSAADLTANYSFVWYNGSDITTDPIITDSTRSSIAHQPAGFYTAIVTLDSVGCTSTPITVEVTDTPTYPNIVIAETPETTCPGAATPNGSLTAGVDAIGTITGYTFEWYQGIGLGGALIGTTTGTENETALELNGGQDYTARVINNLTGCESQLSYLLPDNSIPPTVALSKTDNGICDPGIGFVGSVTAVVTDSNQVSPDYLNNYTFTWYNGTSATPGNEHPDPDPSTPLTLEALPGNFYTLVVTNDILGCSSVPVTIEVQDIPPVINVVITENVASTNCDPAMPNGILAAGVDDGLGGSTTTGYAFEWYVGVDTDPTSGTRTNTDGTNDFRAIELQGGATNNYTVRVTEIGSGCEEVLTVLLNDESEDPIVTLTTTPNAGCTGGLFTGSVTAVVTYKGLDVTNDPNYTLSYSWTGPNGYTSSDATTITGVEDGDYTLEVTETILGCTSAPVIGAVGSDPATITITDTNTPSTNCIANTNPNGEIVASTWIDLNRNTVLDAGEDDPTLFNFQ
ncbi:MAG: hypothetical protein ABFS32_06215, partial [Bacteroidota bacterium]